MDEYIMKVEKEMRELSDAQVYPEDDKDEGPAVATPYNFFEPEDKHKWEEQAAFPYVVCESEEEDEAADGPAEHASEEK